MSARDPRIDPKAGDVLRSKRICRKVMLGDPYRLKVSDTPLDQEGYPMSMSQFRRWAKGAEIVTRGGSDAQ